MLENGISNPEKSKMHLAGVGLTMAAVSEPPRGNYHRLEMALGHPPKGHKRESWWGFFRRVVRRAKMTCFRLDPSKSPALRETSHAAKEWLAMDFRLFGVFAKNEPVAHLAEIHLQ